MMNKTLICPHSGRCGGCTLQGVPYSEQLSRKEENVRRLLRDICPVRPAAGMENPLNYRNKVHAVFSRRKDGRIVSGIYEQGTHRVIPVDSCMIEDRQADEIIGTIRRLAASFRIPVYDEDRQTGFLRHVLIRTGHATGQILVVLVGASPVFPSGRNFVRALTEAHPGITSVVLNVNDRKTSMVLGRRDITLYGRGWIEDILCGLWFRISPQSFYQVNSLQTEKLYRKAAELAGLIRPENRPAKTETRPGQNPGARIRRNHQLQILDAYCGIGTIGIYAAAACPSAQVTGVELNRAAVRDAIANAKRNHIENVRFAAEDAEKWMVRRAAAGEPCDILFMDPPRTGSTETFIRAAARLAPERIVYISCNPETLARDLRGFRRFGYTAGEAWPYDLFPFTGHVETVVMLEKPAARPLS